VCAAAAGWATLVCMDLKTRSVTPLPDAAIERFRRKLQGA
jgi:acyl-CoA thioesterase FadM